MVKDIAAVWGCRQGDGFASHSRALVSADSTVSVIVYGNAVRCRAVSGNDHSRRSARIVVGICLEAHIVGAGGNLGCRSGAERPAGACGGIGVILHLVGRAGDLALSAAGSRSCHAEGGGRDLISRGDGECPCRII